MMKRLLALPILLAGLAACEGNNALDQAFGQPDAETLAAGERLEAAGRASTASSGLERRGNQGLNNYLGYGVPQPSPASPAPTLGGVTPPEGG